ncbi:sensor histidine kinase [Streptomyces sp. B6B3]|uniref:sensor histidine kinase n=1 Tax=Streptomyces sp. B6B3 TaxID=3153570 RepID=UPI00325D16E4
MRTLANGRGDRGTRAGWRAASWWWEGATLVVAVAACLFGTAAQGDVITAPPASGYPFVAASCALLPLRHGRPLAAVAVTTGCGVLAPPMGFDFNPLLLVPVMVAVHAFALHREPRAVSAAIAVSVGAMAASSLMWATSSWEEAGTASTIAFPLLAGAFGNAARNRRALLAAERERARRAELGRENEARRRVVEERMRIARELHDVVAHHMTLVHAQAAVAALYFDSRPEVARESLGQLTENTSDALDELRATVGLLRQSGDPDTPLDPTPGLADLPALVASFQRAGLTVAVHGEGSDRSLPPGLDLTAYRIVQEALTNVAKHAGTGAARVDLGYHRDRLTVSVTDEGRRRDAAPDRAPGHGLIGMRERATAVGGRLSAGPRPEGGYLVSAELPLPPPRHTPAAGGASAGAEAAADSEADADDNADADENEASGTRTPP